MRIGYNGDGEDFGEATGAVVLRKGAREQSGNEKIVKLNWAVIVARMTSVSWRLWVLFWLFYIVIAQIEESNNNMYKAMVSYLIKSFEVWASEKIALRTFRNEAPHRRWVNGESDQEIFSVDEMSAD